MISTEQEIARIHRLEVTGVITWLEAEALEAAAVADQPTSLVHALGRLQLADLQSRWLAGHANAGTGAATRYLAPSNRDQLIAQILDRVS